MFDCDVNYHITQNRNGENLLIDVQTPMSYEKRENNFRNTLKSWISEFRDRHYEIYFLF